MSSTYSKAKKYTANVRLRSTKFANFNNYYHQQTYDDPFATWLREKIEEHKKIVNIDNNVDNNIDNNIDNKQTYHSPITQEGFYFKTLSNTKCTYKNKNVCIIDDLLDRDVSMKILLYQYDFVDKNGNRIVGTTIKVTDINN